MTVAAGVAEHAFALFLGLQRQARQAASSEQLAYAMVNDGQALFGFRHAALLIAGKVQALTGISVVEPHAPFVAFVERAAHTLQAAGVAGQPAVVDPARLDAQAVADWQSLSAAHAYWLPLLDRQGEMFGGLWLARDQAFNPAEQALLNHLGTPTPTPGWPCARLGPGACAGQGGVCWRWWGRCCWCCWCRCANRCWHRPKSCRGRGVWSPRRWTG